MRTGSEKSMIYLEPVRAGVEASGMSEEEVNQIFDEALDEVRSERKA